ncbi:ABC transporter permease subunit [uncultured Desulfuromonas sp.]|uniref:ABC transporter permease n=1 Tax=uncultured Desulfuromonas sp. TaxID=181013 RepID=UPI002AABDF1C|nr:ABC transporter permease subunit [uncultured Desulfuromonas sp.]
MKRYNLLGTLALLALWWLLARMMPPLTMASPWTAITTALRLLGDAHFLTVHLAVTLTRVSCALVLGSLGGFILGLIAGSSARIMAFLEPFRRVLTGIPGIVVAVLAMLWFGLGSRMAIFIGSVFILPVVYLNIAESLRRGDRALLDVVTVYRLPLMLRIRYLYTPLIGAALASSLTLVIGNCMRLIILAEVLGAGEGLGYLLSLAKARLDMPMLYGTVLISLLFVWSGEMLVTRLLARCVHG